MKAESRPVIEFSAALDRAVDQHGISLAEISQSQPALVVFLRHSGCAFCREALADLHARREEIERAGARIVVVQMSKPSQGVALLASHGLSDVSSISDPDRGLYRAFDLQRGSLWQILRPWVWWRGFQAAILARHGAGPIVGDAFQMPGAFLLRRGQIVRGFRHATAADRPDYVELACSLPPPTAL